MTARTILLTIALAGATVASAQDASIAGAMAAGQVGEQADGYLGVRGAAGGTVRAQVEAINIKRRQAYTDLAAQRGVTVKDVAAAVGCTTLKGRIKPGQAYQLRDGVWRVHEGSAPDPASRLLLLTQLSTSVSDQSGAISAKSWSSNRQTGRRPVRWRCKQVARTRQWTSTEPGRCICGAEPVFLRWSNGSSTWQ